MSTVEVYVYDLSQGMASLLSPQLLGRPITGIWHTSTVVYGREFYFGNGIHECFPGKSGHGLPSQKISLPNTEISLSLFRQHLHALKMEWTGDKYHLLENNCNSFTNELCVFLTGTGIPEWITGLPKEFMETELGRQLRPVIDSMFSNGGGDDSMFSNGGGDGVVGGKRTGNLDKLGDNVYRFPLPDAEKVDIKLTQFLSESKLSPSSFEGLLEVMPLDKLFPLLDSIRIHVTKGGSVSFPVLFSVFERFLEASKATQVTILKLACALESRTLLQYADVTVSLVVESLLSGDLSTRQAGAVLVWNLSLTQLKDEILVQIVPAIIQSLGTEKDEQVSLRLLGALGNVLRTGSDDIVELVKVLDLHVDCSSVQVTGIVSDIESMLK
jgi:hypothetical protein